MKYKMIIIFLCSLSILLAGCGVDKKITKHESAAPTAEEVLKENKDADIFMLNNTVYETNIEWVDDLSVTKNKEIGEVVSNYSVATDDFKNEMATKLPKGCKIFSTNERSDILIVDNKGSVKKYYALTEG